MVEERLKYATVRRNKKTGTLRYYWQRPGFPLVRLPDNPVERFSEVARLNTEAETKFLPSFTREGSVAWVIRKYRMGKRYTRVANSTRRIYERWLEEIEKLWGELPMRAVKRRAVVKFIDCVPETQQVHAAAVLANLFKVALYHDVAAVNYASRLEIIGPRKRQQVWADADVKAFMEACKHPHITLAFTIMLYTAQRPGDVLRMPWASYNGDTITVRQEKTGTLLEIPCHAALRAILDGTPRRGPLIITTPKGRAVRYGAWRKDFNAIRESCGLGDKQARDLRRTATVKLAEAGATVPEIAAVTGHSIQRTTTILETYLPRNVNMARSAILKLERKQNQPNRP